MKTNEPITPLSPLSPAAQPMIPDHYRGNDIRVYREGFHAGYKYAFQLTEKHSDTPQPVPVSERLPGPEDCNAEGRCWWFAPETEVDFGGWTFGTTEVCANSQWVDWENTHWLPAHALPLPEVGND